MYKIGRCRIICFLLSGLVCGNCGGEISLERPSKRPQHLNGRREGEMPMTIAKSAPLASNWGSTDEKTDVGIGISRVKVVAVVRGTIGNGR